MKVLRLAANNIGEYVLVE